MRADMMVWVQRITGAVFAAGVAALIAAVVTMARQAETVPPLPIFLGVMGLVALILLTGACMALISVAISARRGAEALQRLTRNPVPPTAAAAAVARPFSGQPLREVAQPEPDPAPAAPVRPARPAGRTLVAER